MLGTNDVLSIQNTSMQKIEGGGGGLSACRKLKSNDIDGSSGGGGEGYWPLGPSHQ